MKKIGAIVAFILSLNACGLDTTTTKNEFFLLIYGVYSDPLDNPDGNTAPKFYEMTLESILLTPTSGDVVTLTPDTVEAVRVIDREQIIYTGDLGDYEDVDFSSAQAVFSSDIVVGARYKKDHSLTLSQSQYTSDAFTAEKGKNIKMTVEVKWQYTVEEDSEDESEVVYQPQYDIDIDTSD